MAQWARCASLQSCLCEHLATSGSSLLSTRRHREWYFRLPDYLADHLCRDGLSEITDTISEPFEVFSPKQFKGMHESTPLTRHLATQGLKVKLRQDHQGGKGGNKRRASSNSQFSRQQQPSPPSDALSPAPRSAPAQPSHLRYPQGSMVQRGGPGSTSPYAQHRGGLVWPGHFPSSYPGYPEYEPAGPAASRRSPGAIDGERPRKVRRSMGHEDGFGHHDISSRLDLSCEFVEVATGYCRAFTANIPVPSPSSDLSAFSLGNRRPQSSSSAPPPSRHDWARREYPPGDDGLPHLVLSPPGPQYPSSSRAPPLPPSASQEYGYPRLPRIVSASNHHHPAHPHHRHHEAAPPHELHQHHAPSPHSQHYSHSHSHPHSYSHSHSHHASHQSQHRPSSSPSYSHDPRALSHSHAQHYHAGPPPPPASHSQYPSSPPPVLPPIRHSRSRSPSVPRHYDRDPRT